MCRSGSLPDGPGIVIIAVGVDIVEVGRVRRLLEEHPRAEREIFTDRERIYCAGKRNRLAHLAARFAAKEAVLKALGTGLGPGVRWTDVEIRNDSIGRPSVHLAGRPAELLAQMAATAQISVSHTATHAIAQSVVLGTAPVHAAGSR